MTDDQTGMQQNNITPGNYTRKRNCEIIQERETSEKNCYSIMKRDQEDPKWRTTNSFKKKREKKEIKGIMQLLSLLGKFNKIFVKKH